MSDTTTDSTKNSTKANTIKFVAILLVPLALIAAFIGGMQFQKHGSSPLDAVKTAAAGNGSTFGAGSGQRLRGNGQAPIIGNVTSVSGSSLSIQTRQGSTDTVNVTSSTQITDNQSTAQLSDIQAGDRVLVFGAMGSGNTITASRINVNPRFGGGAGAGAPGGAATQTN